MSVYFQMGHHSENLIGEQDLDEYKGIILSPINRSPDELTNDIGKFCDLGDYHIIFDPQLYFPHSERGKLNDHPYFPSDFETADLNDLSWWKKLTDKLSDYALKLCFSTIASPVFQPKVWRSDYYRLCADISNVLSSNLESDSFNVYTTVMADISELADLNKIMEIASIVSDTESDGYYIVFRSDMEPRRELSDESELFGMMSLVNELKQSGRPVLVSNCSSDMILYKVAGAADCATGKFFNLRRFTKSRYEEPKEGGGQLPYWFEHSLFTFLREADLLRLLNRGFEHLIAANHSTNYWSDKIIAHLSEKPKEAWLALSWRQYLSWFGKTEAELSQGDCAGIVKSWLKEADSNWADLEDDDLLFDERRNNGGWIRPWHQALVRFTKSLKNG